MAITGQRGLALILSATLLTISPQTVLSAPARQPTAPPIVAAAPPSTAAAQAPVPSSAAPAVETEKQRKKREKAEAKARKQAERAERRRLARASGKPRHAKRKKILRCAAGAIVGGLAAALLGGREGKSAGGVLLGAAAGCAAGWALGEALKGDDDKHLDKFINEDVALRDGETVRTWRAPTSGHTITVSQADAGYQPIEATFFIAAGVMPPQPGVLVEGRALRSTANLRMRSSPATDNDDNIIGSFATNEIVMVVAQTGDRQWALIGENNVIIGYASTRYLSTSLAIPPEAPIRYATLKRTPPPRARGGRSAAAPAAAVASAPPQQVRMAASTHCKHITAAAGPKSQTQRKCAQPNATSWA